MKYPKRLIEVDLPIKRISAHARREKSIRHGHISTLHIWWARRPLAACRAVICAALWPDPADSLCPDSFVQAARREMLSWTSHQRQRLLSEDSRTRFEAARKDPRAFDDPEELRAALLDFIADFSNWNHSIVQEYLESSCTLTQSAHEALGGTPGTRPLVVDPFAGGGSIPLEALRVGADAFASDLNPVPVLLNKVLLDYIPRFGSDLVTIVSKRCRRIEQLAHISVESYFPKEESGAVPLAYLWARTVLSEAPGGQIPIEVPLISSMWLSKKTHRGRALRWKRNSQGKVLLLEVDVKAKDGTVRRVARPELDVFEPKNPSEVESGTVKNGAATCPVTGYTTPPKSVRQQLASRGGGARDARLMAVVTIRQGERGRFYRVATAQDEEAAMNAAAALAAILESGQPEHGYIPTQNVPARNSHRAVASLSVYGIENFGELFLGRQALVILALIKALRVTITEDELIGPESERLEFVRATNVLLALMVSKLTDYCSSLSSWSSPASQETVRGTFGRQTLAMVWDFAEANVFAPSSGGWNHILKFFLKALEHVVASNLRLGTAVKADATVNPLPNDVASCLFTDPPYYDSIPYAELSDYFYVWLKQILQDIEPDVFRDDATPKEQQAIVWHPHNDAERRSYEDKMLRAMVEGRRISSHGSIGVVVFAHKSTAGWESQLQAMIDAGWVVTASWPIDTERTGRTNANNTASLASSVHLVCRPRENSTKDIEVGDWRDVLEQLPRRIHEWMPRLAEEGVVGADAIFACLGPALEIFSRYSRVEKASGDVVTLQEYLEQVWAAVAKEALSMVFEGADASGFEPDARLTAIWLWTLNAGKTDADNGDSDGEEESDDESEGSTKKPKKAGFVLEYDAARKIAQGLGAHLENLGSLVEVLGDQARLLPVAERARYLFGNDEGKAVAAPRRRREAQMDLFKVIEAAESTAPAFGETKLGRMGETVIDRIHQSMILFAAGRGEALKRLLVEGEVGHDSRFWRLAQALSALYPKGSDEKRWVDGVLARKKGLGL